MIAGVCERAAGKCPPPPKTSQVDNHPDSFKMTANLPESTPTAVDPEPPPAPNTELMESFQFSEAEDRLAQLMMDDELSDARLGDLGVDLSLLTSSLPAPTSDSKLTSHEGASKVREDGRKEAWQFGDEVMKNNKPLETTLERKSSKSVVMATKQELTVDLSEKERLEDSLAIAR